MAIKRAGRYKRRSARLAALRIDEFSLVIPPFGQPFVEGRVEDMDVVSAKVSPDGNGIMVSMSQSVELESLLEFLERARKDLAPYMGKDRDSDMDDWLDDTP
jgi:hypothetical protein